jgi:hypothetical protein
MDDAFRMVAAHVPRTRRLTPFAARALALLVALGLLVLWFSMFVVSAQHDADARRAQLAATQRAEAAATAQAAASIETAVPATPDAGAVGTMLDTRAQSAATAALDAARRVASSGSVVDATPNALTPLDPTALFVDGPSTGPSVVSIYAGAAGWAAAVHGAKDTCFWIALTTDGRTRYGTGEACTGMAALAADRPAWSRGS